MRVVLIRHAHVLVDWATHYTSAGYDAENEGYDRAPVEPLPPIDIPIEKVYISSLPRTEATAAFLVGKKRIEKTGLIDEVPLRAPFRSERKMPVWLFNALATIQWHAGSRRQPESRAETDRKIDAFLDRIEAEGEDCIVVGHGIYFYEMMKRMRRRGYSGRIQRYMKNGEILEFGLESVKAGAYGAVRDGRGKRSREIAGCGSREAGLPCSGARAAGSEE
jgi:broad specificity phosphatase PhoE